jgi:anti-sigma regulatory factor (Ser/Thr protein kinase)
MGTNGSTMLEPLRQGLPPLDPAAVSDAASCSLPARYEAVREARRFTRSTLGGWGVDDRSDDACLVVSELVTNALLHGAGAPVLRLTGGSTHIRIEVGDSSEEMPKAREPGPGDGWGMHVIGRLSSRWGISQHTGGKVVWCELAAPLAALAPDPTRV